MTLITITHPVQVVVVDGEAHTVYAPIDVSDKGAVLHFVATYNRALRLVAGTDNTATVHLGERTADKTYTDADGTAHTHKGGWLEHTIVTYRADGTHAMTVGAIQRTPDSSSEFHS